MEFFKHWYRRQNSFAKFDEDKETNFYYKSQNTVGLSKQIINSAHPNNSYNSQPACCEDFLRSCEPLVASACQNEMLYIDYNHCKLIESASQPSSKCLNTDWSVYNFSEAMLFPSYSAYAYSEDVDPNNNNPGDSTVNEPDEGYFTTISC